ncbi:hypothetical protein ACN28E_46805 [Archangium lansingense]|uniref:hypothetical protein n=1 Tax=Archangium lansingense TaxID=2995310 RepID=UPI003B7C582E
MRPSRRRLVGLTLALPLAFGMMGVALSRLLPGGDVAEATGPTSSRQGMATAAEPPPPPRPVVVSSPQDDRIRALEQKVAELSARAAPREQPRPTRPPPPPSPEEAKQRILQRQRAQLEAHQREPLDFVWAKEAHSSFAADLSSLSREAAFRVRNIDCRTTTCVVNLEWASYEEASASYPRLLQHAYGLDCTRSIVLPEPEGPNVSYQANLLLDCENLR